MNFRDLCTAAWQSMPWNGGAERYRDAAQTPALSVSDGTFADWLRENGSRRGAWSEITYFTCLKTLAETLGKLPWKVYKTTPAGTKESKKKDVVRVLKIRPNPYTTPTIFWATMEMNRNHYGNAYAYVEREFRRQKYGGTYKIKNLWIMPSNCVRVLVDDAGIFAGAGQVWYLYTDPYSGKQTLFKRRDVIHVTTSHTMNGIVGKSVEQILHETIAGSQASQAYLDEMYEQGLTAKAVLEYTGSLSPEAKEAMRQAMEDFGAGRKNAGRIMPIPLGMKLTPLDIKLTDAQFYELRKYSALQIAGAFGVKPNQLNDYSKSSYANSEMQQLSFLTETMLFVLKQYEEEAGFALLGEDAMMAGEYVKINEKALLRTDSKTQMEILSMGVQCGVELVNEARNKLDKEAVEGGDTPVMNGTMTPLSVILEKTGTSTTAAEGQQTPPGNTPPTPPQEEETPPGSEETAQEGQKGGDEDGD